MGLLNQIVFLVLLLSAGTTAMASSASGLQEGYYQAQGVRWMTSSCATGDINQTFPCDEQFFGIRIDQSSGSVLKGRIWFPDQALSSQGNLPQNALYDDPIGDLVAQMTVIGEGQASNSYSATGMGITLVELNTGRTVPGETSVQIALNASGNLEVSVQWYTHAGFENYQETSESGETLSCNRFVVASDRQWVTLPVEFKWVSDLSHPPVSPDLDFMDPQIAPLESCAAFFSPNQ